MLKKLLIKMYNKAVLLNHRNILSLLDRGSFKKISFCDLGCNNGELTLKLARILNSDDLYGIEVDSDLAREAKQKGIEVLNCNLNHKLSFQSESFDVIHACQIIEHLYNFDLFLEEIYRILKKDGYVILSTENLSSWDNIASLFLGFQPFSSTNISRKKASIGNPFALHKNDFGDRNKDRHVEIFSYKALVDLIKLHGFKIIKIKGSGYFPLPAFLGNIDKRHARYLTIKLKKQSQ